MTDLVIGMGEVGQALTRFLDCPGRDVEDVEGSFDQIHIAFPWDPDFEDWVVSYERLYSARVIVHSTVPVGTCDPHGWTHSPIRGRHPHLLEALARPKTFGGPPADWSGPTVWYPKAALTEAGKLWELAQYGIQIRVTQAIHEWCADHDLDPDVVYRDFAVDYNHAYEDTQFVRPVLDYVPGPIGGHCITQNMGLLDHPLARLVEEGF